MRMSAARMRIKCRYIACAGLVLALSAACGQKGPLYLPDKKGSAVHKPAAPAPQTATQPDPKDPQDKDDSQTPP